MAVAKKCDRCGKYYEALRDNTYQMPGETEGTVHFINSIRIGNWNQKTKSWVSIASAYDLCRDCGQEIAEVIFGKGELQMRFVPRDKTKSNRGQRPNQNLSTDENSTELAEGEVTESQEDNANVETE